MGRPHLIPLAEDYFGFGLRVPSHPKGGAAELKANKIWGEATLHCCSMITATNHPKIGDKYKLRLQKEIVASMVGVDAKYSCMLSAMKNGTTPGVWQAGTKDKIEDDGTAHLITSASLIVFGGPGDHKAKTYNFVAEVTDKKGRTIPALFDSMKVDFTLKHGRAPTRGEIADLVREDTAGIFGRKGIVDIVYTIRSVQRTPNRTNSQIGVPKVRRVASGKSGTSGSEITRRSKAWKAADQCRRRIRGINIRLADFVYEQKKSEIIERIQEAAE